MWRQEPKTAPQALPMAFPCAALVWPAPGMLPPENIKAFVAGPPRAAAFRRGALRAPGLVSSYFVERAEAAMRPKSREGAAARPERRRTRIPQRPTHESSRGTTSRQERRLSPGVARTSGRSVVVFTVFRARKRTAAEVSSPRGIAHRRAESQNTPYDEPRALSAPGPATPTGLAITPALPGIQAPPAGLEPAIFGLEVRCLVH